MNSWCSSPVLKLVGMFTFCCVHQTLCSYSARMFTFCCVHQTLCSYSARMFTFCCVHQTLCSYSARMFTSCCVHQTLCSYITNQCNVFAGYDVKPLAEYLDWVGVMTYDFHGQWDKKTGH